MSNKPTDKLPLRSDLVTPQTELYTQRSDDNTKVEFKFKVDDILNLIQSTAGMTVSAVNDLPNGVTELTLSDNTIITISQDTDDQNLVDYYNNL